MSTTILATEAPVTVGPATLVGRIWRVTPLMPWSGDTSGAANTYRSRNAGKSRDVRAWLGVRYAEPPVGSLRWREAVDYDYPAGTYQCDRIGNVPHQTYSIEAGGDGRPEWGLNAGAADWGEMVPGGTQESEDCLFLHIWAPPTGYSAPTGGWPVVFWMHGGGFTVNSAATYHSRGHRLATKGVIVVSVEYRLSNFGTFFHPDFEAEAGWNGPNFMLSDVKSALRWVNRNIASFGGNPAKVMMGGTSAGAVMTLALQEDDSVQSLYSSVWVSSGGGTGQRRARANTSRTLGYAYRYDQFVRAARAAAPRLRDYGNLAQRVSDRIAAEATEGNALRLGMTPAHVMAFSDGRKRLWPGRINADGSRQGLIGGVATYTAWQGPVNDNPPYIGNGVTHANAVTASRMGRMRKPAVILAAENESTLIGGSHTTWTAAQATEWLRLLNVPHFSSWSSQSWTSAWNDAEKRRRIHQHVIFGYSAWKITRNMVASGSAPAWLTLWAFSTAGTAGHSSDVHFEFGNVEWNVGVNGTEAMVTERSLRMAEGMMRLFVNMANSGNPNTSYHRAALDFDLFATPPGFSLTASEAGGTFAHWNIIGAVGGAANVAATAPVQAVHQAWLPDAWAYYDAFYAGG